METIKLKNNEVLAAMNDIRTGILEQVNAVKTTLEEKIGTVKIEVMAEVQTINKQTIDRISETDKAVQVVESRVDKLERQALAKEIVITGIPCQQGENVVQIFRSICQAVAFNPDNVTENCFRIPSKKDRLANTPIIVKFWYMGSKQLFMNSYFKMKNLNLSHIGFKTNAPNRIYINESLTPKNRDIFSLAQRLKKDKKIENVRTRGGLVSISVTGRSSPMCIFSKSQLDTLNGNTSADEV